MRPIVIKSGNWKTTVPKEKISQAVAEVYAELRARIADEEKAKRERRAAQKAKTKQH